MPLSLGELYDLRDATFAARPRSQDLWALAFDAHLPCSSAHPELRIEACHSLQMGR